MQLLHYLYHKFVLLIDPILVFLGDLTAYGGTWLKPNLTFLRLSYQFNLKSGSVSPACTNQKNSLMMNKISFTSLNSAVHSAGNDTFFLLAILSWF